MLQSVVQPLVRNVTDKGSKTLIQRAITSLRARGTDAHLWLPGGDVRTYGPELVTTQTWTVGYGTTTSTVSVSSGNVTVTNLSPDTLARYGVVISGCVVGNNYKLSASMSSPTGTGDRYMCFTSVSNGTGGTNVPSSMATAGYLTVAGTWSGVLQATATTMYLFFIVSSGSNGATIPVSNISVREITSITSTITSGLTTGNYLESTGNTLATVDNPTGLVLDALGSVGVELVDTANTAAAWVKYSNNTVEQDDVAVKITYVDFGNGAFCNLTAAGGLTSDLVANKTYHITALAKVNAGNSVALSLAGGATGSQTITSTEFSPVSIIFTPTGSSYIAATSMAAGEVIWVKNISVREVSGIHAQQGTTQNKPVLRRGAYNYLLNSVLAGAAAGTPGTAPTSWTFAFGTGSVEAYGSEVLTLSASAGRQVIFQSVSLPANATHIVSVFVNSFSGSMSAITQAFAIANLPAGTTVTYYKNGVESAAVPVAGDTLSARIVTAGTAGAVHVRLGVGIDGNRTGSFGFSKPQLETGSTASAYSPTTTAAASNPNAGRYSWAFDSTDVLSATIPAGWETATVIDAAPAGAVASVQNVVGTHSIRGAMVTGVNLVTGDNSTFTSGVGSWIPVRNGTISASSGKGLLTPAVETYSGAKFTSTMVVGAYYYLEFTHRLLSGTAQELEARGMLASAGNAVSLFTPTATETKFTQFGTCITNVFQITNGNAIPNGAVYEIDNISVYEINPVTHARILVKGTLTDAETDLYKSLVNSFK